MNDDTLSEASLSSDTWQELVTQAPEIVIKHDSLIATLAEAARRHRVMVNISVSPYELDADDQ